MKPMKPTKDETDRRSVFVLVFNNDPGILHRIPGVKSHEKRKKPQKEWRNGAETKIESLSSSITFKRASITDQPRKIIERHVRTLDITLSLPRIHQTHTKRNCLLFSKSRILQKINRTQISIPIPITWKSQSGLRAKNRRFRGPNSKRPTTKRQGFRQMCKTTAELKQKQLENSFFSCKAEVPFRLPWFLGPKSVSEEMKKQ